MRNFAMLLGLAFVLSASPAIAGGFDFSAVQTNASAGAESIVASPIGAILGVIHGDDLLGLPFAAVTDRMVGAVTGGIGGAFALVTGAVDLFFAAPAGLVGITPVSPVPIINLW